jgi:hypothetical protein
MSNPLFEIVQIWKTRMNVYAGIEIKGEYTEVKLPRKEFEEWLDSDNRLDWTSEEFNNERTDIVEKDGRFTIGEYWEYCHARNQAQDIHDFIITTKIGIENLFESVYETVKETCKEYSNNE